MTKSASSAPATHQTNAMIAQMNPELREERYIFCSTADNDLAQISAPAAIGVFREEEGTSLILLFDEAIAHGFACGPAMRMIRLNVHSSLEGVGLTAAVAGCLAREQIACNVVAAVHHDHLFVPETDAERALTLLLALQAEVSCQLGRSSLAPGAG